MNMELHSTGASFIAHTTENNPRDLIIELVRENPSADRKTLFEKFRDLIRGEDDYQRAVDWYFFVNMHDYLVTNRNKRQVAPRDAARERQQIDEIKQRVVNMVLLDLVLPNGKRLRECTFAEVAKAGGWFAKIAKKGKPNQIVGKVLTEEQLRAIK